MRCKSPSIVSLLGVVMEEQWLVLEFMEKGSLFDLLKDLKQDLAWYPTRWQLAHDVAKGVSYLHSIGILHRDLKSANVLLDSDCHAKIADFGLSAVKLGIGSQAYEVLEKTVGTIRYLPPEACQVQYKYRSSSDVYCMGTIFWEISSRKLPYYNHNSNEAIKEFIKKGETEKIPKDCPKAFGDLISKCWKLQQKDRPTAAQAVYELVSGMIKEEQNAKVKMTREWHIDRDCKSEIKKEWKSNQKFKIVEAAASDVAKVVSYYLRKPVPGMDIGRVQVLYSPSLEEKFCANLKLLQNRAGNKVFDAKWPDQADVRNGLVTKTKDSCKDFVDPDFPNVTLLPLWHGTRAEVVESVLQTGFVNLATTDGGFFGKGIYSAFEAEYAHRVYSQGALLLNWVSMYSAFHAIDNGETGNVGGMHCVGDMVKLAGKGNYGNFDATVAYVRPASNNPLEVVYYPIKPNEAHTYVEVVVFDSAQCLPRFIVELQPLSPLKSLISVDSFLGKLGMMDLKEASRMVYESHLGKPYTLETLKMDWDFEHEGHVVNRPNHGLAHTLRTMAYAPFVIEYYLQFNALTGEMREKIGRSVPAIQLALLFYVSCRENEAGTAQDAVAYERFRENSAKAFWDFVAAQKIAVDQKLLEDCYFGVRHRGYGASWVQSLITMCHDLDLLRCLDSDIFNNICLTFNGLVGAGNVAKLKALARECCEATGDRIWGMGDFKADYTAKAFVKCSTDVNHCIQQLHQIVLKHNKK